MIYINAPIGLGKQVSLDTNVLMADGTKKQAKNIKMGDIVLGQDGKPTKIIGVYPHKNKKFYRVTLLDGRNFKVCDEHLIPFWSRNSRNGSRGNIKKLKVKPLGEMLNDYVANSVSKTGSVLHHYKYLIPLAEPVEYAEREHIISPYAMGVLLSEGSLHEVETHNVLKISANEEDVLVKFMKEAKLDKYTHYDGNYTYNFPKKYNPNVKEINDELKRLDLCHTALYKSIPEEYLVDSVKNRKELLKGLIDTDGSIVGGKDRNNYSVAYYTSSPKLRDTFLQLVDSLGYGRHVFADNHRDNTNWSISVFTPDIIWSSKKHSDKASSRQYKSKKDIYTSIINIERIDNQDGVCFSVDNEDHLFLIDNYVVTHNTSLTKLLSADLKTKAFYERVDDMPMLKKFYEAGSESRLALAFPLQVAFLNYRYQQLREGIHLAETEGMKNTIYDSSLLSDGLMAFNLYKRGEFPEEEFRLYQELSQNMQANVSGHPFSGFPDVVIYLKSSFPLMVEHIVGRGRDMETIDDDKKDYYHSVWETYNNWYKSYAQSPVITIDMDKYDYVHNSKDRKNVLEYIESKLNDFGLLSDNELDGLFIKHDIKDNKVEIGNTPTAWTPAPEDTLNKTVK